MNAVFPCLQSEFKGTIARGNIKERCYAILSLRISHWYSIMASLQPVTWMVGCEKVAYLME